MNNEKILKVAGMVCTVVGLGLTIVQKQLEDKKLAKLVADEVQRQLGNK